ncbi:MAG: M56 family metallopeptidase [Pirellulaceae bacterium]
MNEYLIAFLWALIQITLCCLICLCIVWKLRGRHPQLAAALLSGACVANAMLLLSAAFPRHQWSLHEAISQMTADENARSSPPIDADHDVPRSSAESDSQLPSSKHASKSGVSWTQDTAETMRLAARLPSVGWEWMHVRLLQFDSQLRQVSESKVVQHRFSTLTLTSIAIMLAAFALWLVGWFHARSIARHCTPVDSEAIRSLSEVLQRQVGCHQDPKIYTSPRIAVGATMGWQKPIVLLNENYMNWQPEQLTAVLAHELAHAARRDYAWVLVSSLTRVLLWFHPLVHLLVRRLRLEQELAADQIAANSLGARAYGRALAQLALANQISLRTPSPMLAASQICVIRRISMLKQGRLKPHFLQRRWAATLTLMAIATALPLSGLRGQTGGADELKATTEVKSDAPKTTLDAQREEELAALKRYPPFRVEGTAIYRQDRLLNDHSNVGTAWLASLVQHEALGRLLPADAVLSGDAAVALQWRDLSKEHGSLSLEGTLRAADNVLPGEIAKWLSLPAFSHLEPSEETRQVDGRTAQAYTGRGKDDGQVLWWVVNDKQGFHRGSTIEELESDMHRQVAEVEIPEVFRADYDTAAAAVVFNECTSLKEAFLKYIEGSRKAEMDMVTPMLDGLESLGLFLVEDGGDIKLRARFVDDAHAERVGTLLSGLIAGVRTMASDSNNPVLSQVADVTLHRDGRELSCSVAADCSVQLAASDFLHPSVADGWFSMKSDGGRAKDGTFELPFSNGDSPPYILQQSIDATPYRGRRIRLVAEANYRVGYEQYAGLAAWTNDSNDRANAFVSQAGNGTSNLEELLYHGLPLAVDAGDTTSNDAAYAGWKSTTFELDVPEDATNLTLAMYCVRANFKVRELSISEVGPASAAAAQAIPSFVTVFNIPGRPILDRPSNLGFETAAERNPTARVAESESESESKSSIK